MINPKVSGILLLALIIQFNLSAQDKLNIKFGKIAPEDFNITSPLIDSGTNAVVVADVGKSVFLANRSGLSFYLEFTEKKRIKIINKNGFDAATVLIRLYVGDNSKSEKLEDLKAYTYNNENGKVVETKVDKSTVFTEQHSKHWIYKKFTFPALKEGSIIEYSYKVSSDFLINLQPWTFQNEYPVLWSQYEADIPDFYKYVTLSQGYQPFFKDTVEKIKTSFSFVEHTEMSMSTNGMSKMPSTSNFNVEGTLENHTWVMKNVPALKEEPFTTTLRNSESKIEFQLNQIVYPNSTPQNYMNTWEKVATELMLDDEFGVPVNKPNNWLDNEVANIVKTATSQRDKAQKIFEYVRNNFTCNDNNRIFITTDLKDVYKNKNGSVADINMLLIAMLKNQKIDAIPVILSTRDNGVTHEFYPLMNRYNYIIAKVIADDATYYLDATVQQLAFGKLPAQVYNGQAREITNEVATPVYFLADSLREIGNTRVFIANMDEGGVEGSFSQDLGFYASLDLRNKMTKIAPDAYKKTLQKEYPEEIAIDNIQIDSLKMAKEPVGIKFNLKLKSFADNDIVYFNPMLNEAIKKNPFAAAERFYPVEMPYKVDDTYTLMMEIPKGYTVDELPKSVRFNLNENEGMFEYLISNNGKQIQMKCRLKLDKATYSNDDYQTLREFYTFIVKKESEQIVFKKPK